MRLYSHPEAPNPRRVRIFLAEKGLEMETVDVDVHAGENATPEFLALNSRGLLPVLVLDDGRALAESLSISRYLEELHPEPPLFGIGAEERAFIDMWSRRMELDVFEPVADVGRHTIPFFEDRLEQNADYAAARRRVAAERFAWLDRELADGREWVAGPRFSVADVTGMVTLRLAGALGAAPPAGLAHLEAWAARLRERPSWDA